MQVDPPKKSLRTVNILDLEPVIWDWEETLVVDLFFCLGSLSSLRKYICEERLVQKLLGPRLQQLRSCIFLNWINCSLQAGVSRGGDFAPFRDIACWCWLGQKYNAARNHAKTSFLTSLLVWFCMVLQYSGLWSTQNEHCITIFILFRQCKGTQPSTFPVF